MFALLAFSKLATAAFFLSRSFAIHWTANKPHGRLSGHESQPGG
jgi:hypothetical protein